MPEKYHLFYNGEFSQWYPSPIFDPKFNKTFNCCEQYMMAAKASVFDDKEIAIKIMKEESPKIQKELGREVKNFDKERWDKLGQKIVYRANLLKFSQHRKLLELLFSFDHDTIFVEASVYDKIWGIGLSEDDPDALDKKKWKGRNYLGYAITKARNNLLGFYDV